jgi:hypothetical protein
MKINVIFSFCLVAALTGCGIFSKKSTETPVIAATQKRVVVEPELLINCELLPPLTKNPTYDDIAQHYIQIIGLYGECALKQSASIETIRKLANQEITQ